MSDAGMSAALVDQAIVVCPVCHVASDVWSETCECGQGLLEDTRRVKIMKSHAEPHYLLGQRAERAEKSAVPDPAAWAQGVRDLAALRRAEEAEGGPFPATLTARIAALLLRLDRVTEAVTEATVLHDHHALPASVVVSLAQAYEAAGDSAGADGWLGVGFGEAGDDLHARVPLVCEQARLLMTREHPEEALGLLEPLEKQLDEEIKRTEKSGGAMATNMFVGGDTHAYAVSMWQAETTVLNKTMAQVKAAASAARKADRARMKAARAAERAASGATHWWQR